MVNDTREMIIDSEFGDVMVDGNTELITDIVKYIQTYIKEYGIASVGVTIVHANAKQGISKPSDKGTMSNLYTLFTYYYKGA